MLVSQLGSLKKFSCKTEEEGGWEGWEGVCGLRRLSPPIFWRYF